jgi:CheY-like chemotaxis protein
MLKILLIEDHPGLSEISCSLLRDVYGHEVHHAATGAAALEQAANLTPDIVLLDLNLPDIHGYQLAERLRQLPHLDASVMVALTGFGNVVDPDHAASVGIDAHFRKPMDFDLLEEIAAAGRSSSAGSETEATEG